LIRTLVGDRSFRVQEVRGSGDEFDEDGEPGDFAYYNIYSKSYVEFLLGNVPFVKSWQILPDRDFDKNRIEEASAEQPDSHNATSIIGDWQVNGCILMPWSFIEVEIAR